MKKQITEPQYPAILHFIEPKGDREYIVVATEGPISDHLISGYEIYSTMEIDEEGSLPTDTPLHK